MSTTAIQRVVDELQELPESEQEQLLSFVRNLKRKRVAPPSARRRQARNPALKKKNGRLVFTGKLLSPRVDWLRAVREEREDEIMRQASGRKPAA